MKLVLIENRYIQILVIDKGYLLQNVQLKLRQQKDVRYSSVMMNKMITVLAVLTLQLHLILMDVMMHTLPINLNFPKMPILLKY